MTRIDDYATLYLVGQIKKLLDSHLTERGGWRRSLPQVANDLGCPIRSNEDYVVVYNAVEEACEELGIHHRDAGAYGRVYRRAISPRRVS